MMRRSRLRIGEVTCVTSKFVFLPSFDRAVKRLKKQYRHITDDLIAALEAVESNPQIGSVIPRDYAVRKLRVSSRDLRRGKSGGFRLLYKVENADDADTIVYVLLVYAKTDQADVSLMQLQTLMQELSDISEE